MVEALKSQQFSTINYINKNGEKVSATKQGQTVTLINDKNETRQLPLNDFIQNELPNAKDIKLENSPAQDTVEISTKQTVTSQNTTEQNKKPETGKNLNITA